MEKQQINIEGKNLNVTLAPWNSDNFELTRKQASIVCNVNGFNKHFFGYNDTEQIITIYDLYMNVKKKIKTNVT